MKEKETNTNETVANLIRYRLQDDGINIVSDQDLSKLEKWIKKLLDKYYI